MSGTRARAQASQQPRLLTVEEAATQLGIGRTKMYRLVGSGDVESITIGTSRRVPPECLDEFIATQRRKQARGKHNSSNAA